MPQYIGIADSHALATWVRSVANGHYAVEFSATAKTAYITGTKMVIPRFNAAMTLRDQIRLRGFCIHETSHPIYQADAFRILKENPMQQNSPLRSIYNMVLDVHAETCRASEWAGDAKALSEFGAVTGRDVTDNLKPQIDEAKGELPEAFEKVSMVMVASIIAEGKWNTGLRVGFDNLISNIMPERVRDGAEIVRSKFDTDKRLTDPNETPESLWLLSKDIFTFLFDKPPESEINPPPGKKGKKGEGKPEDGEDEPKSGSGSELGDDDGGEPAEPEDGKLTVDKLVWSQHYEIPEDGGASGKGFDYTNHTEYQMYTPVEFNEFKVIDYDKGET